MKDIAKKMKQYKELHDEIDDYIHEGSLKYLKETKQLFSDPQGWRIDFDFEGITFYGEDGCMGCYDKVSFWIPMSYFGLTEEDFKE